MKKTLCILLSVIMLFSVFAPISVFAESGPYPPKTEVYLESGSIAESYIDLLEYFEGGGFDYYSSVYRVFPESKSDGFLHVNQDYWKQRCFYDYETNTLTINNLQREIRIAVHNMGDDFKINVKGYNSIYGISSDSDSRGASVTLIGDGELIIGAQEPNTGIYINGGRTASLLKIGKDVKLKVYADENNETVIVDKSLITDADKIIQIEGELTSEPTVGIYEYSRDIYAKLTGYWFSPSIANRYVFKKNGDLFCGERNEKIDDSYFIYPISYDEVLGCYCTDIIEDKNDYLVIDYTAEGYEKLTWEDVPDVDEAKILIVDKKVTYNSAYSEDGLKQYAFSLNGVDGYFSSNKNKWTSVYEVIEHEKYGLLFKYINLQDDELNKLVREKTGEITLGAAKITGELSINNGGQVAPGTVKLVAAKNDYHVNMESGVCVKWEPLYNAVFYRVYRKGHGEKKWTVLNEVRNSDSYFDRTAKSGVKYTYTVKAFNYAGAGGYDTKGVSVLHLAAPELTLKPTANSLSVKWNKVAGAKTYNLYRKLDGEKTWTVIKRGYTGTSYNDKNVENAKMYHYTVRAVNGKVSSDFEDYKAMFFLVPKLLKAENTKKGVKVTWEDVPYAWYNVYRKTEKSGWEKLGNPSDNVFYDKNVENNTTYTYTVTARGMDHAGTYDKKGISVYHIDPPEISLVKKSNGVQVQFASVAGAQKYRLYRQVAGTNDWVILKTGTKNDFKKSGSSFIYNDTKVESGVKYEYAIRSINSKGSSETNKETIKF